MATRALEHITPETRHTPFAVGKSLPAPLRSAGRLRRHLAGCLRLARDLAAVLALFLLMAQAPPAAAAAAQNDNAFVGALACESCHPDQYANFLVNSRKAHSWRSIQKMSAKLDPAEVRECYVCHTTGYGQPGGFVSYEKTPELANVSCEACHGPGARHAESGDPADILGTPDVDSCSVCHNAQRVENFNFKPMLYHGGH